MSKNLLDSDSYSLLPDGHHGLTRLAAAGDAIVQIDLLHLRLGAFLFGLRAVQVEVRGHRIEFQLPAGERHARDPRPTTGKRSTGKRSTSLSRSGRR